MIGELVSNQDTKFASTSLILTSGSKYKIYENSRYSGKLSSEKTTLNMTGVPEPISKAVLEL